MCLQLAWLLVGCLCFTSHRQRGHLETAPPLLSLSKDVKLDFYTVPTGYRTLGSLRVVEVHYTYSCTTPAPFAVSYFQSRLLKANQQSIIQSYMAPEFEIEAKHASFLTLFDCT